MKIPRPGDTFGADNEFEVLSDTDLVCPTPSDFEEYLKTKRSISHHEEEGDDDNDILRIAYMEAMSAPLPPYWREYQCVGGDGGDETAFFNFQTLTQCDPKPFVDFLVERRYSAWKNTKQEHADDDVDEAVVSTICAVKQFRSGGKVMYVSDANGESLQRGEP